MGGGHIIGGGPHTGGGPHAYLGRHNGRGEHGPPKRQSTILNGSAMAPATSLTAPHRICASGLGPQRGAHAGGGQMRGAHMGGGHIAGPYIGRGKNASALPAYVTTIIESMPTMIAERTRFFFVMKRLLPHISHRPRAISMRSRIVSIALSDGLMVKIAKVNVNVNERIHRSHPG
jgi:hypothetical protein